MEKKHKEIAGYGVPHSLEETARYLGITRQRVQQIERNALKKLRTALNSNFGATCTLDMM